MDEQSANTWHCEVCNEDHPVHTKAVACWEKDNRRISNLDVAVQRIEARMAGGRPTPPGVFPPMGGPLVPSEGQCAYPIGGGVVCRLPPGHDGAHGVTWASPAAAAIFGHGRFTPLGAAYQPACAGCKRTGMLLHVSRGTSASWLVCDDCDKPSAPAESDVVEPGGHVAMSQRPAGSRDWFCGWCNKMFPTESSRDSHTATLCHEFQRYKENARLTDAPHPVGPVVGLDAMLPPLPRVKCECGAVVPSETESMADHIKCKQSTPVAMLESERRMEDDATLGRALIALLSDFAGDHGDSEGAEDCLRRLLGEVRAARARNRPPLAHEGPCDHGVPCHTPAAMLGEAEGLAERIAILCGQVVVAEASAGHSMTDVYGHAADVGGLARQIARSLRAAQREAEAREGKR